MKHLRTERWTCTMFSCPFSERASFTQTPALQGALAAAAGCQLTVMAARCRRFMSR